MVDLRHLAVILDAGRRKAEEYQDAPLSAALAAMTEVAVVLHIEQGAADPIWDLPAMFADLAERLQ